MKKISALVVAGTLAIGAGIAQAAATKPAAADAKAAPAAATPEMYDSWRMNCQTQKDAGTETCSLSQLLAQNLGKDPNDATKTRVRPLATVVVGRIPGNDLPQLQIRAPLGTLLQAPVLKVPGFKDIAIPYLACEQNGCVTISVGLEKDFLAAVKAAEAAETSPEAAQGTLVMLMNVTRDKATKPEAVSIKFALKGFSRGLEALNKKLPAAAPAPAPAKEAPKKDAAKKK